MTALWWVPNLRNQVTYPKALLGSLFTDTVVAAHVLSRTHVFGAYSTAIFGLSLSSTAHYDADWGPFWGRVIPLLAAHRVKLSLELAGPRGYSPGTTTCADGPVANGTLSAQDDLTYIALLEALGGTVDYITMDGGLRRTILNGVHKANGCNMSIADSCAAVVAYMQAIHAARPSIRVGLTESVVLWPYDGVAGYAVETYPADQRPDFKTAFTELMSQVVAGGEILDHLHYDSDVEHDLGLIAGVNSTADGWMDRSFRVGSQARTAGVRVGRFYNSVWGGNPGSGQGASDAYYQDQVLLHLAEWLAYRTASRPTWGDLDDLVIEDFYQYPEIALDDLSPQTGLIVADSYADTLLQSRARYGPRRAVRSTRGIGRRAA